MATVRQFELLAGRALVDNEFRARLQKNPKSAAREVKVRLTNADVDIINTTNWVGLDAAAKDVQKYLPALRLAWGGLTAEQLKRQAASFKGNPPPQVKGQAASAGKAATKASAKSSAKSAPKSASRGSTRRKS